MPCPLVDPQCSNQLIAAVSPCPSARIAANSMPHVPSAPVVLPSHGAIPHGLPQTSAPTDHRPFVVRTRGKKRAEATTQPRLYVTRLPRRARRRVECQGRQIDVSIYVPEGRSYKSGGLTEAPFLLPRASSFPITSPCVSSLPPLPRLRLSFPARQIMSDAQFVPRTYGAILLGGLFSAWCVSYVQPAFLEADRYVG